jgi:hypothetical protein
MVAPLAELLSVCRTSLLSPRRPPLDYLVVPRPKIIHISILKCRAGILDGVLAAHRKISLWTARPSLESAAVRATGRTAASLVQCIHTPQPASAAEQRSLRTWLRTPTFFRVARAKRFLRQLGCATRCPARS